MEIALKRSRLQAIAAQFLLGSAGLALTTFACFQVGFGVGRTGFAYVALLALVSLLGSFTVSILLSVIAAACLEYFFAPPLFAFGADVLNDIVRIAAFLTTSLVVTAVTARLKRTREELRASKARLEATQRIAQVGWWERDLRTGHVTLSDEVRRTFGVQPTDLPEWHARWLELIHPEDRAPVAEAAAAALVPAGPRYDVEYRVVRADGSVRIVHSHGDVTWDDSGRPLSQFGVLQDITQLRQAEHELRASEGRFRTFADQATDAFFLLDDHSTVLDVNRQACESLGYSREELIGKHRSAFDAGLNEVSVELLKERIVAEEAVTFETHHRRKNGSTFPVEVRVRQFDQGERRLLCLVRDITERKRAEDELRASEARFRTFVDNAIDGFFLLDVHSIVLDVNHQACANLGYRREELIGQHRSLFDPDLDQASVQLLAQYRLTDQTVTFETRHRRKDGSSFPVEVRVRQFEQGGRRFLALVRDLSERKQRESELRESEERFRMLVRFSFDAYYWETDAEHRFIRQEFAEGLADAPAPGSEIGKTRWEIPYLEPDAEAWRKHHETLDAHLPFRDFELARPTAGGGKRYISASGLPVFDETGRFTGYRGIGRHITERKRAQQEHERLRELETDLAHLNRRSIMGELTASLAHEILHPIATARNNARAGIRFLQMTPPDLFEVKDALACVVRDADRAKDIVGRIRDHIKKAPPRAERFDLNEAINEVIEMVRNAADRNRVSVRARLMENKASTQGDRVQLQQVILNLILNALEAMSSVEERTRDLWISTELSQTGDILVAVRDSGPGIEPEQVDRLFEPFYTTKTSGLGMGLSICRSIIDAHDGRLWAESNQPRGAVFQFTVPRSGEPS